MDEEGVREVTRDEARKLMGGYATGTLTEAERKLLFEAALDDQELFDELAGEEELKNLLDAPGVRGRLSSALAPPAPETRRTWWIGGWVGAAAAVVLVAAVALTWALRRPEPQQIAAVQPAPASGTTISDGGTPAAPELARSVPPQSPQPEKKAAEQQPPQAKPAESADALRDRAAERESDRQNQAQPQAATAEPVTTFSAPATAPEAQASERRAEQQAQSQGGFPAQQNQGGGPAIRAAAPAAAAKSVLAGAPLGGPAFTYSIVSQTIRGSAAEDGSLTAAARVGAQVVSMGTRSLRRNVNFELSIPDGASSIMLTFSKEPVAARKDEAGAPLVVRATSGTVVFPRPGADVVTVELQLR